MSDLPGELGLSQGKVALAQASERWELLFGEEQQRLDEAMQTFGAAVEHCGSTSVRGLLAKPILDILVGVPEPLEVAAIKHALEPLGYEHATWAGVPGHEVFGKGDPRTHLVHVVPLDGSAWDRMVRFRDALRKSQVLANEYGELKRGLAERYPDNRPAYTAAKAGFVERVLAANR